MPDGFPNRPKILRGAFVEYGLSIPPLIVVFQFNPVELTRNRSLTFTAPNATVSTKVEGETEKAKKSRLSARENPLRKLHQKNFVDKFGNKDDLMAIRDQQIVSIQEESISLEIRLDATDGLNDADAVTKQFGIAPQLSTLELMVLPKAEGLAGKALRILSSKTFSFTKAERPPMILFIWGRKKVLPVNINSMNVTEKEFSTDLNPVRATVSMGLTVIEGLNIPYSYTHAMKEAMSTLNLANLTDVTDVVIPG